MRMQLNNRGKRSPRIILNIGVNLGRQARAAESFEKWWRTVGETPKASRVVGNGEGCPPTQPSSGSGGASWTPPEGSGAQPRPKLNLVNSECQRNHLSWHVFQWIFFHISIVVVQLCRRFEWKEGEWRTHDMHGFYRAMLCIRGRLLAVALCPSVCPSQAGVLLKWLNVGSHKEYHTIAQGV